MSWSAMLGAFGLVFLAELGDKSQLAVISQTCRHRVGLPVFLGSSAALVGISGLGAVSGRLLGRVVPQGILQIAGPLAFLVMGVLVWREASKCHSDDALDVDCDLGDGRPRLWNWQAFASSAALLFVAELGDKTQLAILGLASREAAPWAVFAGGSLALLAVTALAVVGGQQLCRLIPRRALLRAAAILFVVMAALMGFGIL